MGKIVLYKEGGWDKVHGIECQQVVINSNEIDDYMSKGWVTSPQETQNKKPKKKSVSRKDLENKAKELGIDFSKNIGDEKLLERIRSKIKSLQG